MLLAKVSDLLIVMSRSKRPFFSFLRKGASVASTRILHSVASYQEEINTIFDVGANQGQFATTAIYYYPDATIYSFEPLPDTFNKLKRNTRKNKNIFHYNFALGNSEGSMEFYSNKYSHASSALHVSRQQKLLLPHTSNEEAIIV